jgi:hypothetical protein
VDIVQELKQVAQEREIPVEELKQELELALAVAYQKFKGVQSEVTVRLDPTKKSGAVVDKEVVGEVLEPATQVSLDVARKYREDAEIGDFMSFEIDTSTFGRIAAQTFKQVLSQKIREVEQRKVLEQFHDLVGEVVRPIINHDVKALRLMPQHRLETTWVRGVPDVNLSPAAREPPAVTFHIKAVNGCVREILFPEGQRLPGIDSDLQHRPHPQAHPLEMQMIILQVVMEAFRRLVRFSELLQQIVRLYR